MYTALLIVVAIGAFVAGLVHGQRQREDLEQVVRAWKSEAERLLVDVQRLQVVQRLQSITPLQFTFTRAVPHC